MQVAKSLLLLLTGGAAGIAFVLSCGDNLHLGADAAVDAPRTVDAAPVCDCPAAEPPLAGRFVKISNVRTLPANGRTSQSVACPAGARLIMGSCRLDTASLYNVVLEQSGLPPAGTEGWDCMFRNNESVAIDFRTTAICLLPAP